MYKLIFLSLFVFGVASSIYDLPLTDYNGQSINLQDFRGKKILFVNTASASDYSGQFASLEQLYETYKDSLVIIAVPSNSFGNDTAAIADIQTMITTQYNSHFLVASKSEVRGDSISPVFQWLTQKQNNGALDVAIRNDFYKFLVDQSGNLVGVYDPTVDPMSQTLQNAISTSN